MNYIRIIVLVTAIFVVSLGGGGAWYLKRNAADEAAKAAAAAAVEKPAVVVIVETPIERLFKSANADDVKAQVRLARLYLKPEPENGFDLPNNQSLAFSWFERAANNGDAEAQFQLAEMHLAGRGAPIDTEMAVDWLIKAAEQNHLDAAVRLGLIHAPAPAGRGHDLETATKWLNTATDLGSPRAEAALDKLRLAGRLPAEEPETEAAEDPKVAAVRRLTEQWLNDINRHITDGKFESRQRTKISTAVNGRVSVTFRRLRLSLRDGSAMLIGNLRLDVEPVGEPDPTTGIHPSYRFTGILPPRFAFAPIGAPDFVIKHAPSRFIGEWRPDLAMFTDFEFRLGNIQIDNLDKSFDATIGKFAILARLEQGGSGKWSGRPFAIEIGGVTARNIKTGSGLELAKISFGVSVADLDFARNQKFLGDLKTMSLNDWFKSVLLRAIESQPRNSKIAGEEFDWRVEGLKILDNGGEKKFGLDEAHLSLDVTDLDKKLGRINLALGGGGIDIQTKDSAWRDLLPTQVTIKASLVRLPFWDAARVIVETAFDIGIESGISKTTASTRTFDDKLFDSLAKNLPPMIAAARSGLHLDVRAERGEIAVQLGGELIAHMKPPSFIGGVTNLWIEGIETLEKSAATAPGTAALKRLKPFGEPTTHNGRPALRFQIEMSQDGGVTVNGKDATAVVTAISDSLP